MALASEIVVGQLSTTSFRLLSNSLEMFTVYANLTSSYPHANERKLVWFQVGAELFCVHHVLWNEIAFQEGRITAAERDSASEYWVRIEGDRRMRPGSWHQFATNPAVHDSLLRLSATEGAVR